MREPWTEGKGELTKREKSDRFEKSKNVITGIPLLTRRERRGLRERDARGREEPE